MLTNHENKPQKFLKIVKKFSDVEGMSYVSVNWNLKSNSLAGEENLPLFFEKEEKRFLTFSFTRFVLSNPLLLSCGCGL